jgi:hypothetical protein
MISARGVKRERDDVDRLCTCVCFAVFLPSSLDISQNIYDAMTGLKGKIFTSVSCRPFRSLQTTKKKDENDGKKY